MPSGSPVLFLGSSEQLYAPGPSYFDKGLPKNHAAWMAASACAIAADSGSPGLPTKSRFARVFTYLGWASLFMLGVFEILAYKYGNRKDVLVAAHEESVKKPSEDQMELLKKSSEDKINSLRSKLDQHDQTIRGEVSSSQALRTETEKNLKALDAAQKEFSSSVQSLEQQRKSVEELAKRTERHDRTLTKAQAEELYNKMRAFPGQRFWIITETNDFDKTSEQMRFSNQLYELLYSAGWTADRRPATKTDVPLPAYNSLATSGISIGFKANSESQRHVAQGLSAGLAAANVDSTLVGYSDLAHDTLLIRIGLR